MPPKQSSMFSRPHHPGEGWQRANEQRIGILGFGHNNQELDDYFSLNTPEAKARFVDRLLARFSIEFDWSWPVLYQMLSLAKEQEIWKKPELLESKKEYASFEDYFTAIIKRPFETFVELEKTYQFVTKVKPHLIEAPYEVARTELQVTLAEVEPLAEPNLGGCNKLGVNQYTSEKTALQGNLESVEPLESHGGSNPGGFNQHTEKKPQSGSPDDIRATKTEPEYGTSMTYLLRRLKRDAQSESSPNHEQAKEALAKIESGEITSARQAGIHAGIVRVPTVLEQLRRLWSKATPAEQSALLDAVALYDLQSAIKRREAYIADIT